MMTDDCSLTCIKSSCMYQIKVHPVVTLNPPVCAPYCVCSHTPIFALLASSWLVHKLSNLAPSLSLKSTFSQCHQWTGFVLRSVFCWLVWSWPCSATHLIKPTSLCKLSPIVYLLEAPPKSLVLLNATVCWNIISMHVSYLKQLWHYCTLW